MRLRRVGLAVATAAAAAMLVFTCGCGRRTDEQQQQQQQASPATRGAPPAAAQAAAAAAAAQGRAAAPAAAAQGGTPGMTAEQMRAQTDAAQRQFEKLPVRQTDPLLAALEQRLNKVEADLKALEPAAQAKGGHVLETFQTERKELEDGIAAIRFQIAGARVSNDDAYQMAKPGLVKMVENTERSFKTTAGRLD